MGQVHFYHLTRSDLAGTVMVLLGKCQAAGWRVELRGQDAEAMAWLDEKLWLGPKDGFLAHGRSGGDHDAAQPILLTVVGEVAVNDASVILSVLGADISPADVAAHERTIIIFDGGDGDALARARTQWKVLTDAGCAALYWSEESGRWEEKARKNVS